SRSTAPANCAAPSRWRSRARSPTCSSKAASLRATRSPSKSPATGFTSRGISRGDGPMGHRDEAELSRNAYQALAAIIGSPPPHLVASFRLWHYPLAGPQRSWAFFREGLQDPLGSGALVRRATWDRDRDFERLELGG